jgi:hypothetical protein
MEALNSFLTKALDVAEIALRLCRFVPEKGPSFPVM